MLRLNLKKNKTRLSRGRLAIPRHKLFSIDAPVLGQSALEGSPCSRFHLWAVAEAMRPNKSTLFWQRFCLQHVFHLWGSFHSSLMTQHFSQFLQCDLHHLPYNGCSSKSSDSHEYGCKTAKSLVEPVFVDCPQIIPSLLMSESVGKCCKTSDQQL